MADPIPHVVTSDGPAASAPEGAVPIALYGAGVPIAQAPAQADLAAGADLPTVVAAHNALLDKLRAAGVLEDNA